VIGHTCNESDRACVAVDAGGPRRCDATHPTAGCRCVHYEHDGEAMPHFFAVKTSKGSVTGTWRDEPAPVVLIDFGPGGRLPPRAG
jgi:hypothetical protein